MRMITIIIGSVTIIMLLMYKEFCHYIDDVCKGEAL